jgi:putative transposase
VSGRAAGRREPPRDLFRDRSWRSFAYEESFNGKFRDECLNEQFLLDLADARRTIEPWWRHYNRVRPHSAARLLSPRPMRASFIHDQITRTQAGVKVSA